MEISALYNSCNVLQLDDILKLQICSRLNLSHPVPGLRPSSVITIREDHIENHTAKLLNLAFGHSYNTVKSKAVAKEKKNTQKEFTKLISRKTKTTM